MAPTRAKQEALHRDLLWTLQAWILHCESLSPGGLPLEIVMKSNSLPTLSEALGVVQRSSQFTDNATETSYSVSQSDIAPNNGNNFNDDFAESRLGGSDAAEPAADITPTNHSFSRTFQDLKAEAPCRFCDRTSPYVSAAMSHIECGSCPRARQKDTETIHEEAWSRAPNLGCFAQNTRTSRPRNPYNTLSNGQFQCRMCLDVFDACLDLTRHLNSPRYAAELYSCNYMQRTKHFTGLAALLEHFESDKCGFGSSPFQRMHNAVAQYLTGSKTLNAVFEEFADSDASARLEANLRQESFVLMSLEADQD